ncbi:alpha/beta-hydrolase [Serendipita vermifera]|nr:alpha/beta-hydrolase [Serendipita vermifera]
MNNPALVNPIRKPRNPVVLAHGLYGFDVRGFSAWPKVQIHYWSDVLQVLRRKVGAEVIVTRAPSTGSIQERAANMHDILKSEACGRELNFIAHSMGGLDCRHLISNIKPKEYRPVSLITVCTPHRGSPFMDWLQERIGIGTVRQPIPGITPKAPVLPLPASVVSFLDSPAYSNLTSTYLNAHFNSCTPDSPDVKYWSIAARTPSMSFFHPLWLPKLITDEFEEKRKTESGISGHDRKFGNDGLVPLESAKWGEFLGVLEECDHWDIRGAGGLSAHTPEEFEEKSGDKESLGSKWNWSDWQRFLGIWNDDKSRRDKAAALNQATTKLARDESPDEKAKVIAALEDPKVKQEMMKDAKDNQGISTMDYLLDWVVDNVPGVGSVKEPLKLVVEKAGVGGTASDREKSSEAAKSGAESRKPPRFDLERFYIALSRKLYDEGF